MLKRLRGKRSPTKVETASIDSTSYFAVANSKTTTYVETSDLALARMPTGESVLSAYSPQTMIARSRAKSEDRRLDPLGLSVIYEPETPPSADVVFVHGLGGTSKQTWSKDRDPDLFWPQKWLPLETDIRTARILSFGYNANFAQTGSGSIMRISDFAKDLLYCLRYGNNNEGSGLDIGSRPLIFVVHSMGGLVVKRAYIFGQSDPDYKPIVSSIKSIIFLSSPHRGTDLADVLNRILTVSIFNHSPKEYVSELAKSSPALAELNEQFRHIAPSLQIFSFYETLQTPIGPKKVMILERESSILGYPGEVSKPLDADHHHVCKYKSPEDPNYKSVRDALKSLVASCLRTENHQKFENDAEDIEKISSLLAVNEEPSEDFTFFREKWKSGTCDWISVDLTFQSWFEDSGDSRTLWIHALPASGKSILTTYIVNLLKESDKQCCYFYFRFNDQDKRNLANCLRSLAFQTASQVPEFRKALAKMGNAGLKLEKLDGRTLWKRVFVDILFKIPFRSTLYWVVDALDEADAPRSFIELLSNVSSAKMPIKVLLVSRHSTELRLAFERLARTTPLDTIAIGNNNKDIRLYVEQEIEFLYASSEQKKELTIQLLAKANGNFLWVTLALTEILRCLSPDEIQDTLEGIPMGMEEIYFRMEATIVKSMERRPAHKSLAKKILSWATCSRRPLEIKELAEALQPELSVLDLKHTINETCGHFVVIDPQSTKVTMVHETAAFFLTNSTNITLSISPQKAHEELFAKCISFISSHPTRRPSVHVETRAFMQYAATAWAYHLRSSSPASDNTLTLLVKFLKSHFVLVWISSLAQYGQLKELVYASKILTKYVHQRRKYDSTISPLLHRITDLEVVELWATDMNKIVGKFTNALLDDPSTIYKYIPPFCAKDSRIFKQFGEKDYTDSSISIDGITSGTWDDNLAKILVSAGSRATSVICSGQRFAVLTSTGKIVVYDATTFEEARVIHHGEYVLTMSFNHTTDKLVSYGFKTTKIWDVSSGKLQYEVPCPSASRAMTISFTMDDSQILIGSNDRNIRTLSLDNIDAGWLMLDEQLLKENSDRAFHSSPSSICFSPEADQVAISYKKIPLTVWSLDGEIVGRCFRNRFTKAWTWVDRVIWHPTSGEVLGRYMDGCVFKWHPSEGTHQEINASVSQIACSPEGTLFATTDGDGRLKVYNFHHFTLIYQLSTPGFSSHIAFSPDCRRIYDSRGQFCNVWEPNSLIRLTDTEDHDSERGSELGSAVTTSVFSDVFSDTRDPVTAIALQPRNNRYLVGNEAGKVGLYSNGSLVSTIWESFNQMTAVHIDWAEDGEHVAIFELGGKVLVKRLTPASMKRGASAQIQNVLDLKVKVEIGGIQQILLSSTSKYLLVSSRTSVLTHCVETKTHLGTKLLQISTSPIRWMNHPTNPEWVLSFEVDCVTVYKWEDLSEVEVLTFVDSPPIPGIAQRPSATKVLSSGSIETSDHIRRNIKRLFPSPKREYIIFQHSRASPNQRRQQETVILETAAFDLSTNTSKQLTPIYIPDEIQMEIEIPLAILGTNRFVFLNRKYWMCTWNMDGSGPGDGKSAQTHFFLPRDWLNMDCLALCTMLGDGTFLCPKNGEVAAIRSGVRTEW